MDHDQLSDQKRFLLGECVQAYLPLDELQKREFEGLLSTETYKGVQAMNTTWYEKGIEKERRDSFQELLEEQFGPLSPAVLARVEQLPLDRIRTLRKAMLKAKSLADLGLQE